MDPAIKQEIRSLIFAGLSDPVRKMRLACAVIVSDIAHPDWPDDWPSLMSELLQLISGSPDATDGGMRVLNEFVGTDLTEDQLLPIAREMLPQLLSILGSPQTFSSSTRARSILIFRQCVMTLFTVKDEHPVAVKAAVSEILPQWIEAFKQLLDVDVSAELEREESWDGLSIRTAIYNTIEIIMNSFPSILKPSLPHFLSLTLTHLNTLFPTYQSFYLSNSALLTPPTSAEEDSDVSSDLPGLIGAMLDFVTQACTRKGTKELWVKGNRAEKLMEAGMLVAISYAQMTVDDEETWASDPNAFVADEDDDMLAFNVRAASIDFVASLVDTYEERAIESLWTAFSTRIGEAEIARGQSSEDWWKGYESSLNVVGAISSDLLSHVQSAADEGIPPVFDLGRVFSSIVPTYLTSSELPFLQGRSFVFASQFARALPAELANQYIDAAIQVLEQSTSSVPVKVSAVRALNNFFRHLSSNIDAARATETLKRLLPLLTQTTENTLVLIIESLEAAVKVIGLSIDAETCTTLVNSVLSTYLQQPFDPMLGCAVCELFLSFAAVPSLTVEQNLLHSTLPALALTLTAIRTDPFSAQATAAMDVIDNIFDGRTMPIGDGFFATIAAMVFEVLETTEDRDLIQTGLHIVTTTIRRDVDQLLNWHDGQGRSGLSQILTVVSKLLEPGESESGGLFVGDLVLHLIRTAGHSLGDILPGLLSAFVTRLATAQTASFSQSLVLPFAYLMHAQSDTVLSLLESIQIPATPKAPAQSALQLLLTNWCENVDVFQGYWNLRVSTVALTQLFISSRSSLDQIQVRGDMLITAANSNTIMTRAKARNNPDQFEIIPFKAKALKILLHDAQSSNVVASKTMDPDAESDDGDDEWADDGAEFLNADTDVDYLSNMLDEDGPLSKYLQDDGSDDDAEDRTGETDLKDDPLFNLDLPNHLRTFFQTMYESDTGSFRALAENYLSSSEKELLSGVLQS